MPNLIMKGSIIMKKKRLLTLFAAFAVAFCALVVPDDTRIGLNTVAGAVDHNGIWVDKIIPDDPDIDLNALHAGEEFYLRLTIPKFTDKLDTLQFSLKYDCTAFEYVSGDWDNDATMIAALTGSGILSADNLRCNHLVDQIKDADDTDIKGNLGCLIVSASNVVSPAPDEYGISINSDIVLQAKMRTTGSAKGTSYTFKIDTKDANFNVGYFSKTDGTTWKPVWTPAETSCTVHVANSFGGTITGYNFDYNTDDLYVSICDKSGNVVSLGGVPLEQKVEKVSASTGSFLFKSMPESGETLYLRVSTWCVFTSCDEPFTPNPDPAVANNPGVKVTPVFDEKTLTAKSEVAITPSEDVRADIGDFKISLIGDTNANGYIDAGDATFILRHIVKSDPDPIESIAQHCLANVLNTDAVINAKDATQVLRKVIEVQSIYNSKTKND